MADPYQQARPWSSNEERLTGEALAATQTPGAVLAEMTRPPLPQIRLFPPLFGYTPYGRRQVGIDDVLAEDRYAQQRRDFSGGEGGWQASARFVNGPYY